MLSLTPQKPFSLCKTLDVQPFQSKLHHRPIIPLHPNKLNSSFSCSATPTPTPTPTPSSPAKDLYQPFRPPPSSLPSQLTSLETDRRLEILQNRLGLWYEYAPLIPSLAREGFTPPSIEESTGISGVEQNILVVATKVRDSLISSSFPPELLAEFDIGGEELLYELRLLSNKQRADAARYIVDNRLDAKGAREVARSMKDFERRRADGWESFSHVPGDCLAFMLFRQSREHRNPVEKMAALESAAAVAETEKAKTRIELELCKGKKSGEVLGVEGKVRVPVVRLRMGEVAESTAVVVLPVCNANEEEVSAAPDCQKEKGEFGVVAGAEGWRRWVALPGWEPVVTAKNTVAVAFEDARVLPWKVNRWYKEEAIMVIVDREKKVVSEDENFYLVPGDGSAGWGLAVERGKRLVGMGVERSLGTVVLVVRPPKLETEDQLADEDWE